jgi:hypothetical protein
MRILLTLSILGVLSACTVTGKYFAGDGFNNMTLVLEKNQSFSLTTFNDVGGSQVINGTWSINNRVLTLNSTDKPPFIPNSISYKHLDSLPNKLIIIQYMDLPAYEAIVELNNVKIDTTRDLGILNEFYLPEISSPSLPITAFYSDSDSIKSIKILNTKGWKDCSLIQDEFLIEDIKANFFQIFAQPFNQYFNMKYMYNTEWQFHHGKIYYWRYENKTFNKKYFLKKLKTAANRRYM